jgi:hypothetical protein
MNPERIKRTTRKRRKKKKNSRMDPICHPSPTTPLGLIRPRKRMKLLLRSCRKRNKLIVHQVMDPCRLSINRLLSKNELLPKLPPESIMSRWRRRRRKRKTLMLMNEAEEVEVEEVAEAVIEAEGEEEDRVEVTEVVEVDLPREGKAPEVVEEDHREEGHREVDRLEEVEEGIDC